jgi:putative membrane protein
MATAAHLMGNGSNRDGQNMNKSMGGMRMILRLVSLFILAGAAQAATAGGGTAASAECALFLQQAVQGSMVEVELGELAQRKAGTTGINALGSRMARDHRRIGKVLQMISEERGVVVPASLSVDQRSVFDGLSGKTGAEFDAAYAERMVISHEKLIALFDAAAAGADADVAAFAKQALPLLREGKRLAEVYREVTSRHFPPTQPQTPAVAQTVGTL